MQIIIVADSEWERIDWIECINQNIPEVVMVVRVNQNPNEPNNTS